MKKHVSATLFTLSVVVLSAIFTPANAEITVGTYNVTHANKNNGKRREAGNNDVIKQLKADIYGFQEVIKGNNQLTSIKKTLPSYQYIGKPRSSGKNQSWWHRTATFLAPLNTRLVRLGAEDEYNPIFYNTNTIELITGETFDINGDGSGYLPRICTVAHFKEKTTEKEFYVYNTHLDNKEEKSRLMQTNIIKADIAQRTGTTPVILMGDFNSSYTGTIEKNLSKSGFIHAQEITVKRKGPQETHEKGSTKQLTTIDHILVKPGHAFAITCYKVLDTMGTKTSDHNPVSITFSFN